MTDRDRLIELLENSPTLDVMYGELEEWQQAADYLLDNGIIVAPMPMADWLKRELTEHVYKRCMEEL